MAKVAEELFEASEPIMVAEEPLVHVMLRNIATTGIPLEGAQTVSEVDADVSAWLARGYRLVNTHYLGMETSYFSIVFVLSK